MKDPTRELFSVEELLFIPLSGQEYSTVALPYEYLFLSRFTYST